MPLSFVQPAGGHTLMLTTPEVARTLDITPGRIHQIIPRMKRKPRKVGTVLLWTAADVAELQRVRRPPGRPVGWRKPKAKTSRR